MIEEVGIGVERSKLPTLIANPSCFSMIMPIITII
jgi:hypothetical protein